jgi:hypothetical protein
MRVYQIGVQQSEAGSELSALVDGIPGRAAGFRVWFRFQGVPSDQVSASGDPFLAGLLPFAMLGHVPLEIDGDVSEVLLSGTARIMSIWRNSEPDLRAVPIRAQPIRRTGPRGAGIGCFFSCGVDSFYTLLKNLEREDGASRITHLLFLQGHADLSLRNEALFSLRQEHVKAVAGDLGLTTVFSSTNLREVIPGRAVSWGWWAGSMLAAVGLCLSPFLRRILFGSGFTYDNLYPGGIHPVTDALWGTELVEFVHDGAEASRSRKIQRYIQESEIALRHLKVCSDGEATEYNCGRCEKCVRTAIALRVLRAHCPAMPALVSLEGVRKLNGSNPVVREFVLDNLDLLDRYGDDRELGSALRDVLRRDFFRWTRTRLEDFVFEVDQRLFHGRLRSWAHSRARADGQHLELRSNPTRWLFAQALTRSRSAGRQ